MLEAELVVGRVEHVHLVRVFGAEPVHVHRLGLADPVAARHRLSSRMNE